MIVFSRKPCQASCTADILFFPCGTVVNKIYLNWMSNRLLTLATLKPRPSVRSCCFYMCRLLRGRETVENFMINSPSHYNVNIQSGHMKILEHISACRLFLFWRAAGHLQSISRSGFIWSIACVHIFYVMYMSVYVPIVKSCIMGLHWGLWNRLRCRSRSVVTLFRWDWSYRALFYEINNDINTKALRCVTQSSD